MWSPRCSHAHVSQEIVVGSNMDKIYIVMNYVEHDLKSLMETMKQPFLPGVPGTGGLAAALPAWCARARGARGASLTVSLFRGGEDPHDPAAARGAAPA